MLLLVTTYIRALSVQGLVASILFYTVAAPFPGLYVLLRYDSWPLAWFASAVFWLLCVYLTMVSPNSTALHPAPSHCKSANLYTSLLCHGEVVCLTCN